MLLARIIESEKNSLKFGESFSDFFIFEAYKIFDFMKNTFIYMLFPDTASESTDLALCVYAVITFYIVMDFFGYLRWHKKALAAAATGEFSRTDIPDKLVSVLFAAVAVLCPVIIVVKSIVTGNWGTLIIMAVIAVSMVFYDILDKFKKKTESKWKKRLIGFCHVLILGAAIFISNYINKLF